MDTRSYSDSQLHAAVAASASWRGVLRNLGLNATSAGSIRSVRRHAVRLNLATTHFTGQRRWSDSELSSAVAGSRSWQEVTQVLGIGAGGSATQIVRAHAVRLGLATRHLDTCRPRPSRSHTIGPYRPENLRNAGSLFAATWFLLRGASVSWPLEPCRYDLLVDDPGLGAHRVQVKTTTGIGPDALALVSNSRRTGRAVYAPGEIDSYFVIDGELTAYLIPYEVVAGYGQLKLSHYVHFKIVQQGGLLSEASSP